MATLTVAPVHCSCVHCKARSLAHVLGYWRAPYQFSPDHDDNNVSTPPPPLNTRPSPPAEGYIGNRRGETSERRVAVTEMKARQPRTCDCVPTG